MNQSLLLSTSWFVICVKSVSLSKVGGFVDQIIVLPRLYFMISICSSGFLFPKLICIVSILNLSVGLLSFLWSFECFPKRDKSSLSVISLVLSFLL